jgi:hypothetical protein
MDYVRRHYGLKTGLVRDLTDRELVELKDWLYQELVNLTKCA